jgi:hypothetical protein
LSQTFCVVLSKQKQTKQNYLKRRDEEKKNVVCEVQTSDCIQTWHEGYNCGITVLAAERKSVAGSEDSEASSYLPQHTGCVCIKGLYLCLG